MIIFYNYFIKSKNLNLPFLHLSLMRMGLFETARKWVEQKPYLPSPILNLLRLSLTDETWPWHSYTLP